ncbi:MAG: DNA topoisomerase (ATP-hydrolyzing) [Nitriliruptoraceae bacterium]
MPNTTHTSGEIVDVSLESRMEAAFLDYSMSVIVGRALPDVRDGLKPVQRRILYSMYESGLRPDRPHRKCASAVGEVMKSYHPHGDASIYDALVRMAQDFATREPLIDGHGNFGSVDGDPPAAMRYTEARLSLLAMEMLSGIDEDTVDMVENYDGYATEPVVLPARLPNLLVNGATGIAVGMATNIPPHNLGEVINAALHLLKHPAATTDELMQFVPAPDFPTGAKILNADGIRQAYTTGRGAVTVEAVASTETRSGNLPRIIITEIPYQVNKATLLERIALLVGQRKLEAVRDLRDESSRDGMRIVIELKRGADASQVLTLLYDNTELRTNFNVNMVALTDGAPHTLGLRDLLTEYVAHQRDIITRRSAFRLHRAEQRQEIVTGLLQALDQLDQVIALIRASASSAVAKQGLMHTFTFSERQAEAVLEMQLRRLAALERAALEDEFQELTGRIRALQTILHDPNERDRVLREELTEIRRVHATPRRSVIINQDASDTTLFDSDGEPFAPQELTVMLTRGGYLKVLARRRTTPAHTHASDALASVLRCTNADTLIVITETGMGYRIPIDALAVQRPSERGTPLASLTGTVTDSPVAVVVANDDDTTLLTVTKRGVVKRTQLALLTQIRTKAFQITGIRDNDTLTTAVLCRDSDELLLASNAGLATRFLATDIRPSGRGAGGVTGMKLKVSEQIVSVTVNALDTPTEIISIDATGRAKRSPSDDYPRTSRGTKGVKAAEAPLVFCGFARDLHLTGQDRTVLRPVDIGEAKRSQKGHLLELDVSSGVVAEQSNDPDLR